MKKASLKGGLPYGWWKTPAVRAIASIVTMAVVIGTLLAMAAFVLLVWLAPVAVSR